MIKVLQKIIELLQSIRDCVSQKKKKESKNQKYEVITENTKTNHIYK
jgi:hypothetical protein